MMDKKRKTQKSLGTVPLKFNSHNCPKMIDAGAGGGGGVGLVKYCGEFLVHFSCTILRHNPDLNTNSSLRYFGSYLL